MALPRVLAGRCDLAVPGWLLPCRLQYTYLAGFAVLAAGRPFSSCCFPLFVLLRQLLRKGLLPIVGRLRHTVLLHLSW
jgi:hypothetical protein